MKLRMIQKSVVMFTKQTDQTKEIAFWTGNDVLSCISVLEIWHDNERLVVQYVRPNESCGIKCRVSSSNNIIPDDKLTKYIGVPQT